MVFHTWISFLFLILTKKTDCVSNVAKFPRRRNVLPRMRRILTFDAPIERRVLNRKHHNYLSSQGFGDMDEEEMRKSTVFENLQEKMAANET